MTTAAATYRGTIYSTVDIVLQMKFGKSVNNTSTNRRLLAAQKNLQVTKHYATAAARSGNERAVKIIKLSHYLKNGLRPSESVVDLCDVWLAWGFLVNFMYEGVHSTTIKSNKTMNAPIQQ